MERAAADAAFAQRCVRQAPAVGVYDAVPTERTMGFAGRAATGCTDGVMGAWETAFTLMLTVAIRSALFLVLGAPFRRRQPAQPHSQR